MILTFLIVVPACKGGEMATQTIDTRVILKSDTTEKWNDSTLVLLKSEMAIEFTESGECKCKFGDGIHIFKELGYATLTPSEISAIIQSSIKVTGVKGNSESSYRIGNINITKANIGLGNVDNTADIVKNVLSATKLSAKRTISLTGDVTGSVSTDFSGNASIAATVGNDSHMHSNSTITGLDASKITSGIISIDRLPQGALERCVVVKDDDARFALTTANVQKGDTVKVTSGTNGGKMFFVVDDTKLNTEEGYEVYTAGTATSVPWSGITGKPSTFTPSAHTHTKSQITDFPGALPNPSALTLQFNGTSQTAYTGASALTLNITPDAIGAAAKSHGTHVSFSTDVPKIAGTAAVGTATTVSRSDHVHPAQTTISGNSGSTTKLASTRYIDGVGFNGTSNISHYGTCSTEAATVEKAVSLTGFTLVSGAKVYVKFTVTNTATSPTLNVNGTGAKAIYYRGSAIGTGYLATNRTYAFIYNGTQYELIGDINTDTNTDTKVTNTLNNTAKAYITGTTTSSTNTGTQVFDNGVYLDTVAGQLVATTFKGNLTGNVTGNVSGSSGSCTGNAKTATTLATSRSFSITGGATAGAISFNGAGNVALSVTSLNTDYLTNGSNTLILNCGNGTA